MKITDLQINRKKSSRMRGESFSDMMIYFFNSPVFLLTKNTEKLLSSNCAIIYSSNSPQYFRTAEKNTIILDSVSFKTAPAELQYIESLNIPLNEPIRLKESVTAKNILKTLRSQNFTSRKLKNDFSECALKMLLINISEQLSSDAYDKLKNTPYYPQLSELRKNIYESPESSWNIDDICDEFGISKTYFHNIYFSAFGVTCMQDVIGSRIALAENLLSSTSLSVALIAEQCGYESDSYFMRQFKKTTGHTPTEYRRLFSEINTR